MPEALRANNYLGRVLNEINPCEAYLRKLRAAIAEQGIDTIPRFDISTQMCFTEATNYALVKGRSFAICGINTTSSHKALPNLPSWVPDLSLTNHTCQFTLSRPDPLPPTKLQGTAKSSLYSLITLIPAFLLPLRLKLARLRLYQCARA